VAITAVIEGGAVLRANIEGEEEGDGVGHQGPVRTTGPKSLAEGGGDMLGACLPPLLAGATRRPMCLQVAKGVGHLQAGEVVGEVGWVEIPEMRKVIEAY
jgi:hypothetical protein